MANPEDLAAFLSAVTCQECDRRADWEAVAPSRAIHACDQHLGMLLDDNWVWFVTPLTQSAPGQDAPSRDERSSA